jgi:hypothetical protein
MKMTHYPEEWRAICNEEIAHRTVIGFRGFAV